MYIEEILSKEGCTLKLSCLDVETGHTIDFDAEISTDSAIYEKLKSFLSKKALMHFIVVNNVVYDNKMVDFTSGHVENTLYMTQSNGKVYRWTKVGVSFIKTGDSSHGTCIISNQDAQPFNRREAFRIAVDQNGSVLWSGEENAEQCYVLNVSHNGIAILMKETAVTLGIGYPAEITWAETFFSDEKKQSVSNVYKVQAELVRVQYRPDERFVVGFRIKDEPQALLDHIQKVQTSRGIVKEAEAPSVKKGVERNENWETAKDFAKLE